VTAPVGGEVAVELASQRAQLARRLRAAGVDAARVLAGARDAIGLEIAPANRRTLVPGMSRLGGMPDLPPGVAWPVAPGLTVQFVAQLRLDELAPLDVAGRLPPSGMLWLFRAIGVDADGRYVAEGRIVYAERVPTYAAASGHATWKPQLIDARPRVVLPPYPSDTMPFRDGEPYAPVYAVVGAAPVHGLFVHDRPGEALAGDGGVILVRLDDVAGFHLDEAVALVWTIDGEALARRDFGAARLHELAAM
jgi:hypothetical protein